MQEDKERPGGEEGGAGGAASREQRPGEAATTRFGMEDGDNTDTPATGGPPADEDGGEKGDSH